MRTHIHMHMLDADEVGGDVDGSLDHCSTFNINQHRNVNAWSGGCTRWKYIDRSTGVY